MLRWFERRFKRVRFIPQMEAAECGAACLAMVLDYHGQSTPSSEVRAACTTGRDGVSAARIYRAAQSFGLQAKAFSAEPTQLGALALPAILHWEFNHFVVLERWGRGMATVIDPGVGRRKLPAQAFSSAFTGVVLTLEPGPDWSKRARRSPSSRRYWRLLRSLRSGWVAVLSAALLLELLGLGVPAATQVLIDHVLVPQRSDWIWPLVLLLGACGVAFNAVTAIRDGVVRRLNFALDLDLMSSFVGHLSQLPLAFFQQRSSGDLIQRVDAQRELREAALKALTATLDGLLLVGYSVTMLAYHARIATLIIGMALVRVALMLVVRAPIQQATTAQLVEHGKELTALVEPLAAPELVRAFGVEDLAQERYVGCLVSRLNAELQRETLSQSALQLGGILNGASQATAIWLGAQAVLREEMTLGAFAGLLTLQSLLHKPLASLVEAISTATRAAGVLARIDDVLAAHVPELGTRELDVVRGEVALEELSFRHDRQGPLLCDSISLVIAPGEKVAIVGRIGQGKTTLLRLITGLVAPSAGRVLLDRVPLPLLLPETLARTLGVVLQEPFLSSDSVRANLCLGWPDAPDEALRRAAKLACIDGVIEALPQGYDSPLGENGQCLSGGERQRLALARALVSNPKVLVLDEATSSLDLATEARVHENLNSLGCTRILVAHRMETVRDADRILVVDAGRIVQEGSFAGLSAQPGIFAELLSNYERIRT